MSRTARFRYVHSFTDRTEKTRHYFRPPKGKRVPLPGPYGSARFVEAYTAALNAYQTSTPALPPKAPLRKPFAPRVRRAGVYILMWRGEITYIGRSDNLDARVKAHNQNGRNFDRAIKMDVDPADIADLERLLIAAFRPRDNRRIDRIAELLRKLGEQAEDVSGNAYPVCQRHLANGT